MHFSKEIIDWYLVNKRDLPWRKTTNPYPIWLSEIILQQTRVDQGLPYYLKFISTFPTIFDLAEAKEDKILKLWQGLGYYSRARNLHKAAQQIVKDYGGLFPGNKNELMNLIGVGDYTASAIASFCYNEVVPAIDGNVYRVLARYFGINEPTDTRLGQIKFKEVANQVIDPNNPATYNQAIMEFGALQCVPKNPLCSNCPLQAGCFAFKNKKIDQLPYKSKKTKQRNRYFYYFDFYFKSKTYIYQRGAKDIWQNLYEYPLYEGENEVYLDNVLNSNYFNKLALNNPVIENVSDVTKHLLSHQTLLVKFVKVRLGQPLVHSNIIEIEKDDLSSFPTHSLMAKYINDCKN